MRLGIDFGTTNSAVASVDADGRGRILELFDGEPVQRTVVYGAPDGSIAFGNEAFRRYFDDDLQGRLLRSLKAFLPQDVPSTTLARRRRTLPELIGTYLQFLIREAVRVTGVEPTELVIGRPVRFHADPERDAMALGKLEEAIELACLPPTRFVLEPIAAARHFESTLTSDKILLVGDFGGGTSDFAVLRVGPSRRDDLEAILAVSGVAQAGDAIDSTFMEAFLMDFFGRGLPYVEVRTKERKRWNPHILREVQRLFYIPLLRSRDLAEQLDRVERRVSDLVPIERLRRLVFDDLGYPMASAIENTKRQLSSEATTEFVFDDFGAKSLNIHRQVSHDALADACSDMLGEYRAAIHEALTGAQVRPDQVDEVFLTGGTSQLPFIRQIFAEVVGGDKLRQADALTSVCEGLAIA